MFFKPFFRHSVQRFLSATSFRSASAIAFWSWGSTNRPLLRAWYKEISISWQEYIIYNYHSEIPKFKKIVHKFNQIGLARLGRYVFKSGYTRRCLLILQSVLYDDLQSNKRREKKNWKIYSHAFFFVFNGKIEVHLRIDNGALLKFSASYTEIRFDHYSLFHLTRCLCERYQFHVETICFFFFGWLLDFWLYLRNYTFLGTF